MLRPVVLVTGMSRTAFRHPTAQGAATCAEACCVGFEEATQGDDDGEAEQTCRIRVIRFQEMQPFLSVGLLLPNHLDTGLGRDPRACASTQRRRAKHMQ